MNLFRRHFILFLIATTFANFADAYVDPGSGHLLLQLFLALVAGALFYMRSIVDWFRGVNKDNEFDTGEIERTTTQTTQTTTDVAADATPIGAAPRKAKKPVAKKSAKKKAPARKTARKKAS